MRSPFPGVDPYIEDRGFWQDFHHSFVTYWRDAIAQQLPEDYAARIDERFEIVETPSQTVKQRLPDVAILRDPAIERESSTASSVIAIAVAPITRRLVIESESREAYIEIYRQSDEQLVSVLELLSPSNKHRHGRMQYLNKRNELLLQDVNLVELDLLIDGERMPVEPDMPAGEYMAIVSREARRPYCEIYAWNLPDRIPPIPVPLAGDDPDVIIDLQAVYDTVYDRGQYYKQRRRLYDQPLSLPVDDARRNWAVGIAGQVTL